MKRRLGSLVVTLVGFLVIAAAAASAQVAPYMSFGLAQTTSAALAGALQSRHDSQTAQQYLAAAAAPSAEETPPPPVSEGEGETIGFPKGFTYSFDESISYAYGDTGEQRNQLPGGFDVNFLARTLPRTNVFAQYYQLQPQILGVNQGQTPVFSQTGQRAGSLPVSILNYSVSSKIDVFVAGLQQLFFVGGAAINGGHPVIFAPTYAAVKGDIGGGILNSQTQFNNGQIMKVTQRIFEQYAANLAIPLSLTPKIFALYIASAEVLVNRQGFNQTNHVQFEDQALIEYNPNDQTTIFFNPSKAVTYFPTDTYPVSTGNFVYGITHRLRHFNKYNAFPVFIQGEVITSNPDNPVDNALGVARVTVANGALLPTIGGNKFTTVQLSIGVGTPPEIIPYP